ncbi:MAG: hypothetical protein GVY28_14450 [Alphaproteobacteria bacterium]|nr:hypothetical protein [Alphaproteobacteria bacterium]
MVLPVGTEVQTGLRGSLTLDIGPSARVTVERLSHFTIGRLNRRGEVMHTLVAVKHGKIDFKVKRVGFRNDFRIASPTGTMAVKGTGGEFDTGEGGQFNYDPDPDNDNDSTSYNDNSSNNDTTFSGDEGSDNNGGYGGRGNPNLTQGGVGSNMTGSRGDDDDFLDGEPDGLNGGRDELNGNTTNRNNNELFEDELGEEDDSGGGV